MARVTLGEHGERPTGFQFYGQNIGSAEHVSVRRKVGEPCDTLHPSSKLTRVQRLRFSKAAKDWATLSYFQKRSWRQRLEYT